MGHSNMGLGQALKPHADSDPFDPKIDITAIKSFLGMCDTQTAVNVEYLMNHFLRLNPATFSVPPTMKNYRVPGWDQNPLSIQYPDNGMPDHARYPNENHIGIDGTFTLKGTGVDREDFRAYCPELGNNGKVPVPFLIVNTKPMPKPEFGYKIFFDNVCSSNRDYSEYFNHGTFIGSTVLIYEPKKMAQTFVQDLYSGMDAAGIVADFNHSFPNDKYKTQVRYAYKNQ